jgi:hypothetical protein
LLTWKTPGEVDELSTGLFIVTSKVHQLEKPMLILADFYSEEVDFWGTDL